ncbi:MAG: ABC transporter permease [Planctomycetes bacterium]|nr:ABC transporter permease [Planctomycetota bacterium]
MADIRGHFRIRSPLSRRARGLLAVVPFALLAAAYGVGAELRHRDNPKDRLMPGAAQLLDGIREAAREHKIGEREDGEPITERWIVVDTLVSLRRLGIALVLATTASIALGLFMGTFTAIDALLNPFFRALSKIPPLALLPILFIYLGTDELPKLALMVIGVLPTLTQDVYLRIRDVPQEVVNKAYTLGASTLEVAFKVVLAQAWPRILDSVRLTLGPLWVFLIASEAISAESGLGYQIYRAQRWLGVNLILPYILWISLLGFAMDVALRFWIRWRHPWAGTEGD